MNPEPDGTRYWSPNTNVFVSKTGDLIIKVAISGLRSQDLEITLESKNLRITGVLRDPELSDARQLLVNEIPIGRFDSVLEVPDGFEGSAAKAAYAGGVLRIIVPRKAGPAGTFESPRRISFD